MGFINTKAKYHEYITFERLTTITLIDLLTYQASKQQLQWRSTTPIVLLLPPKGQESEVVAIRWTYKLPERRTSALLNGANDQPVETSPQT
jgi:hypothetical protein